MGGGVHDSYTFQCGLVGSFTSPGIQTPDRRDHQLLVSHPKDTGKKKGRPNPKRNCQSSEAKVFTEVGFEPGPVCPVAIPSQRSNPFSAKKSTHLWLSTITLLD